MGDVADLLPWVEAQLCGRLGAQRGKRAGDAGRAAALRAKKLAAEGAHRKAVQGLTSETAQLSTEDQEVWARKLLPTSSRVEGPVSGLASDNVEEASNASDTPARGVCAPGKVLDGVRFAALSGFGPQWHAA